MTSASGDAAPGAARGLVLVVEDEPHIAQLERLYLTREGFTVTHVTDGASALAVVRRERPVAVVLDVGLPGAVDGTQVCRILRADGDWTPILFVTARDDEVDRVLGLELGADDYLTKPFSPRELVARVKTVLRRSQGVLPGAGNLTVGRVELDVERHRVWVLPAADAGAAHAARREEVTLTSTEFALLEALCRRPGVVWTRERLLAEVWGYAATAGTRTVDVHVAQVRGKLGQASPIRTVRGVGYAAG